MGKMVTIFTCIHFLVNPHGGEIKLNNNKIFMGTFDKSYLSLRTYYLKRRNSKKSKKLALKKKS